MQIPQPLPVRQVRLETQDPDALAAAQPERRRRYHQISRGRFRGEVLEQAFGRAGLLRERWSCGMRVRCDRPNGYTAFAVPAVTGGDVGLVWREADSAGRRAADRRAVGDLVFGPFRFHRLRRRRRRARGGMTPVRYLKLRRLNQVHRDLRDAESGRDSVTEIASRSGFFDLGRFASEYRALFGELPSVTLGRRR